MTGFRVAQRAPTSRHVAMTLLQTIGFWSVFLFALPIAIHALTSAYAFAPTPFDHHRPIGLGLFLVASCLGLGSGLTMAVRGRGTPLPLSTARDLVVSGPYRFVRNPMAVAGIAQGTAIGLFLADWFVIGYALAGAVLWHIVARPPEERDLLARFGEPYARYRRAVPLWRPRLSPYSPRGD